MDNDSGTARRDKAIWRHAFAAQPCENIEAWSLLEKDLPEELTWRKSEPSYYEYAIYMALSAYAACGKQASGISLGRAAHELGESSRNRFTRVERSRTISELWANTKSLLRMVTAAQGTGIDYALLATSLVSWQYDRMSTIRQWEKDYYDKVPARSNRAKAKE